MSTFSENCVFDIVQRLMFVFDGCEHSDDCAGNGEYDDANKVGEDRQLY